MSNLKNGSHSTGVDGETEGVENDSNKGDTDDDLSPVRTCQRAPVVVLKECRGS